MSGEVGKNRPAAPWGLYPLFTGLLYLGLPADDALHLWQHLRQRANPLLQRPWFSRCLGAALHGHDHRQRGDALYCDHPICVPGKRRSAPLPSYASTATDYPDSNGSGQLCHDRTGDCPAGHRCKNYLQPALRR